MDKFETPQPLADIEKSFVQKMKRMAYSFVACSVIIMALLLFLSPNAAAGVLFILFLLTGISLISYVLAINNNPIKQHALSLLHIYSGIGVVFSCMLGFLASAVMYNANIKERAALSAGQKAEQENIAAEVATLNTQARSEEPVEEVGDWNFLLNRCIPMSTNENCDIESARRKAAQWDGKSTIDLHMAYRVYQKDSFEFRNFRFFRESSWPQTVPVIKKDTLTFTPARYEKGRGGEVYVTYLYENNCEVEYKYIKISDTEVDSYNTRVSATCSDTWHAGFEMLAGKAIRHTLLKI